MAGPPARVRGADRAPGAGRSYDTGRGDSRPIAATPSPTTPSEVPRPAPPRIPRTDPDDVGVTTPVGTTGAAPAYNPSTAESDLQQPGTEPLMDPSLTKRIKSETDVLRRGAERDPE